MEFMCFVCTKSMKVRHQNSIEAPNTILPNTSEPKFRNKGLARKQKMSRRKKSVRKTGADYFNLKCLMPSLIRLHLHEEVRKIITISAWSLTTSLEVSAPNFSL